MTLREKLLCGEQVTVGVVPAESRDGFANYVLTDPNDFSKVVYDETRVGLNGNMNYHFDNGTKEYTLKPVLTMGSKDPEVSAYLGEAMVCVLFSVRQLPLYKTGETVHVLDQVNGNSWPRNWGNSFVGKVSSWNSNNGSWGYWIATGKKNQYERDEMFYVPESMIQKIEKGVNKNG